MEGKGYTDMIAINLERSNRIVEALKARGVDKPCPRCGHLHFGVVAETTIITTEPGRQILTDLVVPTVIVACNHCGYVTQHALGALDIRPEEPVSA